MTRTVEAVCENGALKPVQPVDLLNGTRVQVWLPVYHVYEKGIFKPQEPVDLVEGQRVQVTLPFPVGPATPEEVEEILRLGQAVYEGLTDEDIAEIEACFTRREGPTSPAEEEKHS